MVKPATLTHICFLNRLFLYQMNGPQRTAVSRKELREKRK